jgi:hypothetical protein
MKLTVRVFCPEQQSEVSPTEDKSKPLKATRRRRLWRRDPRCFRCGRETDITTINHDDSATVEHIYPRSPKHAPPLPATVPACAKCNHERGAPV